jgi:glycosyltransferase involved in cell wall biosynthesis
MNMCFITNGVLPVPAVKGGAVENLVQAILDKNEEYRRFAITVLSIFDNRSETAAKTYRKTTFVFVKPLWLVDIVDKAVFFAAGKFRAKNAFNYRYIARRLFYIYRCHNYLRKHNFDKIIFENHHSLFLILKDKKLQEVLEHKIYYHAHNQPYNDFLCGKQIVGCPNYITVSEYIRNAYRERYPGIASRFCVLKNAVNTKLFGHVMGREERMAEREKYGIGENDAALLFTGRISEEKGILQLAEAFLQINTPSLKLLVAGSSFFDTGIESPLTSRLKIMLGPCMNRVIFTGYVKYEEIWKIYQVADIGCFPSTWNEPACLAAVEAMAAGLPFITTNSGGIPEYATPECAVILERDDRLAENLRDAIMRLAADPDLRQKMSAAGKKAGAVYNLDAYYRNFIDIVSRNSENM